MRKYLWLCEQLIARMRDSTWPPHGLMPTTRQLANEYGLSLPTVQMALRHMRTKGHFEPGGPRERYYVRGIGALPEQTGEGAGGLRFHRIAQALLDDIGGGTFPEGLLPPSKELKHRYRCGHPTLRKAIGYLTAKGVLTEGKRTIDVATVRLQPQSRSRICLTGSASFHRAYHGHAMPFLRALERECHQMGWGAPLLYLTNNPGNRTKPADHIVGGYVHVMSGAGKEWLHFHHRTTNRPLVIVDMQESMRGKFRHRVLFRIVPDNRRAGTELARLLWDQGHRHVAFLAPAIDGQRWSEYRLRGVQDIYDGGNGSVTMLDLSKANNAVAGQPPERPDPDVGRLRAELSEGGLLLPEMIRSDYDPVYTLLAHRETGRRMRPLFERALSDPSITAWLCLNDDLASLAMAFLLRRGLRAGRDISIAGFDNSPLSHHARITSYDFMMDRMAPLALRCLQFPEVMAARGKARHVPGQVVVRESSNRKGAGA